MQSHFLKKARSRALCTLYFCMEWAVWATDGGCSLFSSFSKVSCMGLLNLKPSYQAKSRAHTSHQVCKALRDSPYLLPQLRGSPVPPHLSSSSSYPGPLPQLGHHTSGLLSFPWALVFQVFTKQAPLSCCFQRGLPARSGDSGLVLWALITGGVSYTLVFHHHHHPCCNLQEGESWHWAGGLSKDVLTCR